MFYGYKMSKYTSLPCTFILEFILSVKKKHSLGLMGLGHFFGKSDFFLNTCLKCVFGI